MEGEELEIIDSHVHLWPEAMANEYGHAWMTPDMPLSKAHMLADYRRSAELQCDNKTKTKLQQIVYVETDCRYDTTCSGALSSWAQGPLEEITFIRNVVEGDSADAALLTGIVFWAPMHQSTETLKEWLKLVEEAAGRKTWQRVKGFRYLLQAIHDQTDFEALVCSDMFVANLKLLGARGFSFDVGVDQHSAGIWQLTAVAKAMKRAHADLGDQEKVIFVINHMCKPDFQPTHQVFVAWQERIREFSTFSKTYMKLSGAFSEMPSGFESIDEVAKHVEPWVEHVFKCFGAKRVLFGSDWPICNLNSPGNTSAWTAWRDVVTAVLGNGHLKLSGDDRHRVWGATAAEAYRLP